LANNSAPRQVVDRPEFHLLIERNADGIVVIDREGVVLFANPAAQEMFGRSLAELSGSPIGVPVIAGETTEVNLLRPGLDSIDAEMRVVETTWHGHPALLASLRDVTRRLVTEEHVRQAQKMEAIGQLTAGIAHDFNNLLTVATGNLELLRYRPEMAPVYKTVDAALAALARAERLTSQLLAFARRQRLEPTPLDINQVLVDMDELLRRLVGPRVEIEYATASALPPAIADRNQLETALLNIAANARDAMPNGGRFTLETKETRFGRGYVREHPDVEPGHYVTIAASDNGTGMTPDILRHAIEPFFSTKEPGRGTGLGLAMVYGFVRQSGGHMQIESRPGEGTTVNLHLPRATVGTQSHAMPDAEPDAGAVAGTGIILVVEDDSSVRALACSTLRDIGYTVIEAASGETALQILTTRSDIGVVFSDVIMPGEISGADLAREIIARYPHIGLILTSGYTSRWTDPDGILGMVEFIRKPYRRADLLLRVRKVLNLRDPH
jgi:signal transduction histidine kinase/CheY-like chemotaxis protein